MALKVDSAFYRQRRRRRAEPRERVAQLAPRELGDVGQDVARQVCQGDRALFGAHMGFFALFRCHI